MNDKFIFGSLIAAVGVLLLVAIFRPAPEPRAVAPVETAAVTEEADAPESAPETADSAETETQSATEEPTEAPAEETAAAEPAAEPETTEAAPAEAEAAPADTTETAEAAPAAAEPASEEPATEETAAEETPADSSAANAEDLAALNARIAELEAKLAEAQSQIAAPAPAASASQATGAGVGETLMLADGAVRVFVSRIADGAARLSVNGEQMTLATGESAAMQVGGEDCALTLDGVDGGVSASVACGAAAAPAAEAAGATGAPEAAPTSAADVGETLVLADGAVRVFVSRITDGAARLSVNGEMLSLGVGERAITTLNGAPCGITLDGITEAGVSASVACGDALPEPEGASVGETLLLEDGAIRVFVSRVTDAGARLSINGDMATLAPGASALTSAGEVPCQVTLGSIDRGHVTATSSCSAALAASDPASPGETVLLGDGAVRVFVSAVTSDAVRFAINGQTTQTASEGSSMMLDNGCMLAVADVSDGAASFALGCDG